MSRRSSGWITARSQIAFIVGLFIAFGVIVWLELLRFERTSDPLGSLWIEPLEMPGRPSVDETAGQWMDSFRKTLDTVLTGPAASGEREAILLGYAACRASATSCSQALEAAGKAAVAEVATMPSSWDGDLTAPIELLALAALLQVGEERGELLAAWQAASPPEEVQLPSRRGLRQFAARTLSLSGREEPQARSYVELRDIFVAADGLTRRGEAATAELARGLGLIVAGFPGDDPARILLWRTYEDWPGERQEAPLELLLLWWSLFDEPTLVVLLEARLEELQPDSLAPLDAAIGLLALTAAERGSLLGR